MAGALLLAAALLAESAHAELHPPAARKGFQFALRTGVALPFGNVSSDSAMSDAIGMQYPLIFDVGSKISRYFFVGAYLGAAAGQTAGSVRTACDALGVSCLTLSARGGLQLQYNMRPDESFNPWIAYGFGYEIGTSSGTNGKNAVKNSVRGFEYAHILGGIDFRQQHWFGIGPFVDTAIGAYDVAESQVNAGGFVTTRGGKIDSGGLHVWLILGVRAVMLP